MAAEEPHDGERQSDLAVMEANEYKQKRRLERILDSLDAVQDKADEAWHEYVTGQISQDARNITIQRTVQNAIRECYKLLLDHYNETDGRDKYWAGPDPQNGSAEQDPLGVVELSGDEVVVIPGLREFLEAPTFYTTTIQRSVERRNMPDETRTETVEVTMPEGVSYRAYMRLKQFLDDVHDMEISFEEMDDEMVDWGFEEVPEESKNGTEDVEHGDD